MISPEIPYLDLVLQFSAAGIMLFLQYHQLLHSPIHKENMLTVHFFFFFLSFLLMGIPTVSNKRI